MGISGNIMGNIMEISGEEMIGGKMKNNHNGKRIGGRVNDE
jgi:hypothetical protein